MAHSAVKSASRYVAVPRLHYVEYGSRHTKATPVVCLPGLTRNAEDFDRLARVLAAPTAGRGRRVLALDYRGRGGSDWDKNWHHYDLNFEQLDILQTLAAADVKNAIFIGTSRGGLHIMGLAFAWPWLLRGAVLNDIGPVIDIVGLMRIKSYVGKLPRLKTWKEAIDFLRRGACLHFTNVSDADWKTYARQTFALNNGWIKLRYDPALARKLAELSPESPIQPLWPQFEALKNVPVLGIRGENSDILSPSTFAEMRKRHPAFEQLIVKEQGHAPLLLDTPTISAIANFVDRIS